MHFAGIAGFDHQAHMSAGPIPHQVVVHPGDSEQRRYGRPLLVGIAVRQNNHPRAIGDGRRHLGAYVVQRGSQSGAAVGHPIQTVNHFGPHAMPASVDLDVGVEVDQLGQLMVTQNRLLHRDLVTGFLVRVE